MNHETKVIVNFEGTKTQINCLPKETILEAALRNDIDVPFACMAGTCNSCQAKVNQGKVEMEYCDALSEDEIRSGEILTCQARPTTDLVEVTYR